MNRNVILNIEAYLSFFKQVKDITSETYFSVSDNSVSAMMEYKEKDIIVIFDSKNGKCKKIKVSKKCCDKKELKKEL